MSYIKKMLFLQFFFSLSLFANILYSLGKKCQFSTCQFLLAVLTSFFFLTYELIVMFFFLLLLLLLRIFPTSFNLWCPIYLYTVCTCLLFFTFLLKSTKLVEQQMERSCFCFLNSCSIKYQSSAELKFYYLIKNVMK